MRLTILSDNRTTDHRFTVEHGLSVMLETEKHRILMDTGASEVCIRNAISSGKAIDKIDYIFLSHAHKDHAGGLEFLLDKALEAKIILAESAMHSKFYSSRNGMHCISPEWPKKKMADRVIEVGHNTVIDGMHIIADIVRLHPLPKADICLFADTEEGLVPDDFKHEIALYVDGLLFTGCAHNGLMNILDSCNMPVHTVVGGFHLLDASSEDGEFESSEELESIAGSLVERYPDVDFYTGHCTGEKAYATMKRIMGDQLHQFSCGMSLEI